MIIRAIVGLSNSDNEEWEIRQRENIGQRICLFSDRMEKAFLLIILNDSKLPTRLLCEYQSAQSLQHLV